MPELDTKLAETIAGLLGLFAFLGFLLGICIAVWVDIERKEAALRRDDDCEIH